MTEDTYLYLSPTNGQDSDIAGCLIPLSQEWLTTFSTYQIMTHPLKLIHAFRTLNFNADVIWTTWVDEFPGKHLFDINSNTNILAADVESLSEPEWVIQYSRFAFDGTDKVTVLGYYKGAIGYEWTEFSLKDYADAVHRLTEKEQMNG